MNLFSWLLIGHLIGDFLLQTGWMAKKKTDNLAPLFFHCFVYTSVIYIVSIPAGGLKPLALLAIFLAHLLLDQRKFTNFWVHNINNADGLQWFYIVVDQCFHLLVLAVVAQYLTG